jgi:hypothetical protein
MLEHGLHFFFREDHWQPASRFSPFDVLDKWQLKLKHIATKKE